MGAFRQYLEGSTSAYGQQSGRVDELEASAAEFMQHGVRSMIAEGQDPSDVYHNALPIFGEEFLIKAGVVDIVAEARETK